MANTAILFLTMGLIVALSLLMVSEAPMFSFKFKNMKIKGNEKPLILIICAAVFVSVWGVVGLAWTVIAYIVISLTSILLNKKAVK